MAKLTENELTHELIDEDGDEDGDEDEGVEEESQDWGDWRENDDEQGGEDRDSDILCLFCDSEFESSASLFVHCASSHSFDFHGLRKTLALDFYSSFKLINYVRSQVAKDKHWSFGLSHQSNEILKKSVYLEDGKLLWDDDKYLKPFLQDDPVLFSFGNDEEFEDDYCTSFDGKKQVEDLKSLGENNVEVSLDDTGDRVVAPASNGCVHEAVSPKNGVKDAKEFLSSCNNRREDKLVKVVYSNSVTKEKKNIDADYFGSYSSFGIHRDMISDKVRMDAYRQAILNNPSLLNGAVVMDVGCGTGILSLFAAQSGASRVIAIEASDKMATIATQIAKDNGLLWSETLNQGHMQYTGVIKVVQGMVEELNKSTHIEPHSVDVLVSEWMGYCLLYESMLSSVLIAREQWLKPGGAILPDTATIFAAGFGVGGTSIAFWENVYGFNMSCIGTKAFEDAAKVPIVGVVDSCDIVTNPVILQTFDLAKIKLDEMDFTASIELAPKLDCLASYTQKPATARCYGVVLWFEAGFTSRFCKEMPSVLSTSPYTPKTHWEQTILTFQEPIAVSSKEVNADKLAAVGTDDNPAVKMHARISITRATQHRTIDISLEITSIGHDGRKRSWPPQIFNLS